IALSNGLSEPHEPAIAVRDLTGVLKAWIDVGAPDAMRLHRASKAAPRVAVCAQGCLAACGTASRGADPSHRGARTLRNGLRLARRSRATAAAPNAVHADGV